MGEKKNQVQVSYDLTKLLCVLAIYEEYVVNEVLVTFWQNFAQKKKLYMMIKDSHKNCIRIRVNKGCIILFYLGIKRTFTCIIYTHYMMNYI